MTYSVYGLKNCDTCKKALKALSEAGVAFEFVDIRADADLAVLLPEWIEGVDVASLLNKRSTTWRELSDSQKEAALSGHTLEILAQNPTLIKRPVITSASSVTVGWSASLAQKIIEQN